MPNESISLAHKIRGTRTSPNSPTKQITDPSPLSRLALTSPHEAQVHTYSASCDDENRGRHWAALGFHVPGNPMVKFLWGALAWYPRTEPLESGPQLPSVRLPTDSSCHKRVGVPLFGGPFFWWCLKETHKNTCHCLIGAQPISPH